MLQAIGLMVGFYIITRMLQLIGDGGVGRGTRIAGVVTMVVTILSILSLLLIPGGAPRY
ncbi:hypothetical protein NDR89_20475 [Cupriavidus gilardii]|uniref:Uncharacterized protein n=1 Tax=Cupriavidus gilardii TaxID=82541 RepID=A0ABY4VP44_9BURK|nr:hypothetical protein [Cupriavidus gilardii]USE79015.1 hypothetical protein NDR89_20475 [Cupriavidus gilardii]